MYNQKSKNNVPQQKTALERLVIYYYGVETNFTSSPHYAGFSWKVAFFYVDADMEDSGVKYAKLALVTLTILIYKMKDF